MRGCQTAKDCFAALAMTENRHPFPPERLAVTTFRERPELRPLCFSAEFDAAWPQFMRHDPTAMLYFGSRALDRYLDFALAAVDRDEPGRVIARGKREIEVAVEIGRAHV